MHSRFTLPMFRCMMMSTAFPFDPRPRPRGAHHSAETHARGAPRTHARWTRRSATKAHAPGAARRRRMRERAARGAARRGAGRLRDLDAQRLSRVSGNVRVLVSGLSCPWRPQSLHIHARTPNGSPSGPRAQCCQEVFRNIVSCVCMRVRAFSRVSCPCV